MFVVAFEFVAQFDFLAEHALGAVIDGQEVGVNGVGAIATVVEAVGARSQRALFCLEVPRSGIHV